MTKVLVLDESGTINSNADQERYFVLGGILYNLEDLEYIKSKLLPAFKNYKKIVNYTELKSSKLSTSNKDNNLVYGAALSLINSLDVVKPIIYIVDKKEAYTINSYDKKSFKYNKIIQFLIEDLKKFKLLEEDNELLILLDNIDLDNKEVKNLEEWLPKINLKVKQISQGSSSEYVFLQAADLIVGIPKLKGTSHRKIIDDSKLKILSNCFIHIFPQKEKEKFI